MSIATEITRLQNIKTDIRSALVEQGIEDAGTHNMADFADDILAIEGGGGELHGAIVSVTTEEETLAGTMAELYKVIGGVEELVDSKRFSELNDDGIASVGFVIQYAGTYIVRCTDGESSADSGTFDVSAEQIVNIEAIPIEINFVHETKVTIYSAASDTVYYIDGSNNVTVCTTDTDGKGEAIIELGKTLTLYSTVAKDPNNLSNAYSKTITIDADITEIVLMPLTALYWYGNMCENLELGGSEDFTIKNGWSTDPTSSSTLAGVIFELNRLNTDCVGQNIIRGIGTKKIPKTNKYSKIKAISQAVKINGSNAMSIIHLKSKNFDDRYDANNIDNTSIHLDTFSFNYDQGDNYFYWGSGNNRKAYGYALWVE